MKQADARISFRHTHIYPGCRALISGFAAAMPVEFSDGAGTLARTVLQTDGSIEIAVASYVTTKGRAIAAKRWLLVPGPVVAESESESDSRERQKQQESREPIPWLVRRRLA